MRALWVNARKDLARIRRDPAGLAVAVALPIVIGLLLRLINTGNGGVPTAHLLVADHDDSVVSGLLVGAFSQGPLTDMVKTESVTEEEGRKRLDKGDASGLLIIPENFGEDAFEQNPTKLTLITNPAQNILPGILENALAFFVDAAAGLQQILAAPIRRFTFDRPPEGGTYPDSTVVEMSLTVNRLIRRADPYLFPPVIEVETISEEEDEGFDFGLLFFPGMFFMAVLFVGQSLSDDVWKEKERGTLRRAATTPQASAVFLGGKILAQAAAIAAVAFAGLIAGRWVFRIQIENLPLGFVWTVVSGVVMLLLFTLVQLLAASQRGGNMLSSVILFPLIMLGGSFFPFEAMPHWMAAAGRLTPNGWALSRLKDILTGGADAGGVLTAALVLAGFAAVLFAVSLIRLRTFARRA